MYGEPPYPRFGSFDEGYVLMVNPCVVKGISIFLALAERFPDIPFAALTGGEPRQGSGDHVATCQRDGSGNRAWH